MCISVYTCLRTHLLHVHELHHPIVIKEHAHIGLLVSPATRENKAKGRHAPVTSAYCLSSKMYIRMYVCMHVCTYAYMCIHKCIYIYICMYVCVNVYICIIYIYTYVYISKLVQLHMNLYIYIAYAQRKA